jgi:hypothetical protein
VADHQGAVAGADQRRKIPDRAQFRLDYLALAIDLPPLSLKVRHDLNPTARALVKKGR